MRANFNVFKAIGSLFGAGGERGGTTIVTNTVDDSEARQRAAADEAKRKSQIEAQNRQGAASTLLNSPDLGGDFNKVGGKKTLLGGA